MSSTTIRRIRKIYDENGKVKEEIIEESIFVPDPKPVRKKENWQIPWRAL